MVECTPCKAAALIGIGAAICKKAVDREGTPKCEQLVKDYQDGKRTLVDVLSGFKELVSSEVKNIIDKLIQEAK